MPSCHACARLRHSPIIEISFDRATAIAPIAPQVNAAICDYDQRAKTLTVRKHEEMMQSSRGAGLPYSVSIKPNMMGVHRINRDGEGATEIGGVRVDDGIGVLGCSKQVLDENATRMEEDPAIKGIEHD